MKGILEGTEPGRISTTLSRLLHVGLLRLDRSKDSFLHVWACSENLVETDEHACFATSICTCPAYRATHWSSSAALLHLTKTAWAMPIMEASVLLKDRPLTCNLNELPAVTVLVERESPCKLIGNEMTDGEKQKHTNRFLHLHE